MTGTTRDGTAPGRSADTRDRVVGLVVVFGFSVGLGVGTVTIPLLALASGYDPAAVGFLVATAAACQLLTRLALPALLGRFSDRSLTAVASAAMAAAFLLLIGSTELPVFVLAQVLQGAARAVFWTSSQAHAIRGQAEPVRRLVDLNVAGNAGTIVGPAIGGVLVAIGLTAALAAAFVGALVALLATPLLERFPPYDRRRSAGTWRLLRRPGVDLACWASVCGGLWWSMVGSFVPVILVGAGLGSIAIGWSITASEAAGLVALLALRGASGARVRRVVRAGAIGACVALLGIAVAPGSLPVYLLLLIVGGASGGSVTTLAPAMATLVSAPDEQGDALALTGTFRAAALFAAPAAVGALVASISTGPAMGLAAIVVGTPTAFIGRRPRPAAPSEAGSGPSR